MALNMESPLSVNWQANAKPYHHYLSPSRLQEFRLYLRLPSLASFFAIADGLGITPEELIAAMRKEAGVREKSNGERVENDE